ncbi:MAG: PLP-dependent aminotransferase family protein [Bacteroidetes bacterium]|uniref:PLP-dependent aminotransferase family protein n=1 Tax=Candidatus Caccoplasma merdipullorum TaxID=2840718 RepID=A0A9D9H7Z6_9BACT|nr:PLP-dependent aminotransferase family protein [Candidatus Caccoplasma merdipullorum]
MIRPWQFNIEIDRTDNKVPIYRQVADKIKKLIQTGALKPGEALPGSRSMALQMNISRKSVVNAIEQLEHSGLLINRERVGVFVAEYTVPAHAKNKSDSAPRTESVSPYILAIDDGIPDTKIAPVKELSRAYRQLFNQAARHRLLGYSTPVGDMKFRTAVSSMLNQSRGLETQPDDICITRGSQMALYLIAGAILKKGDAVVVEEPCYPKAAETFTRLGLNIIPVAVDKFGIKVEQIEKELSGTEKQIKAIYITPRHHYPTMVPLSPERKRKLVSLISAHQIYLIEDDYDYDFSLQHKPAFPVSAFTPKERTFYIGTFSKVIAPSVRVGYIASSSENAAKIGSLRSMIDIQGDNIMEHAILELINTGDIKRHIKRATRHYKEKQKYFVENLAKKLSGKITFDIPQGGLAIWVVFTGQTDTRKLENKLKEARIKMPLYTTSCGIGARIGYASLTLDDMNYLTDTLNKIL